MQPTTGADAGLLFSISICGVSLAEIMSWLTYGFVLCGTKVTKNGSFVEVGQKFYESHDAGISIAA
jgi:hypothetical protein